PGDRQGHGQGAGRAAGLRDPDDRLPGQRQDRRRRRGRGHGSAPHAMSRVRVITGWTELRDADRGAAVAMGNFDGVHRGHQQVIALAARAAGELGAPLGVITFDPHPRVYFRPGEPAFRLMKPDQQARALEALGVEILYVLPLDAALAGMTDREFATRVLHEGLGARHVAVGFDNTFGKGRSGNPDTMRAYGRELGFGVSVA